MSAECCVTQQLAYFYPQPYESHLNLTAHVRACSVLVSGATLYTRFARLLGNGSRIWLAVGELVLRTAVCCAPQARAKAVSGKKSSLWMLTKHSYLTSRKVGML